MPVVHRRDVRAAVKGATALLLLGGLPLSSPVAQQAPALVIRPLAEKRLTELPSGPLFWRIETFPSLGEARAAEGPTALVVEAAGRVWLFTLGPAGVVSEGGGKLAEVGPIPLVEAPQYLLRINQASGPPGSVTPVHTHPGSEAFYVLAGETTQRTSHGAVRVAAGSAIAGHGADMPMEVSSSGSTDLLSLVMFVVDATKPFSSSASIR
ncbi:cupin domain-containing protein [Roseomonas populi]|uniref:Cupin domain-containing protein n=1 Tax=Roseomonas populi TaxID=3121582 RepID=A0ABT1XAE3_9PROT|nr:cupin domain-containing protein [Roseomonas pecuniae]MCR0985086.1 cupin domain-containing protein [Roseomonas pecuniae]